MSGVVFCDLPGLIYDHDRSMALQETHEAFTKDVLSHAVVYIVKDSDRSVITAKRVPHPGYEIYVDTIDLNAPYDRVADNAALRGVLERMSERVTASQGSGN